MTHICANRKLLVVVSICLLEMHSVLAEESPRETAEANRVREKRFAILTGKLNEYRYDLPNGETAEILPTPLLRWTNPIRKTHDGGVFLWTNESRPVAMSCVFWRNKDIFKHELQSLSEEPFTCSLNEVVWSPGKAGVTYERLNRGPAVAKGASLRLVQMRRIAADFQAFIGKEDRGGTRLRLLPQPLYRYPNTPEIEGVDDGAIFAFVQSTDPEVLLLLEARQSDEGSHWFIAFARMSKSAQYVTRNQTPVWGCNWMSGSPNKSYQVLTYDQTMKAEP